MRTRRRLCVSLSGVGSSRSLESAPWNFLRVRFKVISAVFCERWPCVFRSLCDVCEEAETRMTLYIFLSCLVTRAISLRALLGFASIASTHSLAESQYGLLPVGVGTALLAW